MSGDVEKRVVSDPELTEAEYHHLARLLPQKRMLCPRYFIYNPVLGKCKPTLMVSLAIQKRSTLAKQGPVPLSAR